MLKVYAVKREGASSYLAFFSFESEANYYAQYLRETYSDEKYHTYALFQPHSYWIAE